MEKKDYVKCQSSKILWTTNRNRFCRFSPVIIALGFKTPCSGEHGITNIAEVICIENGSSYCDHAKTIIAEKKDVSIDKWVCLRPSGREIRFQKQKPYDKTIGNRC